MNFELFLEGPSSQTTCTRNRIPPKAFCWSHLGCIRTKFLKSWFHVIDDYRLKYFSSAGLPWSPASNSLTHHECSQLTSTSRMKVSLWLESASFTENLDESSASVKKRCKKYLGLVATISCNVSQRVSRKGCMKDNSLKFISSSCLFMASLLFLALGQTPVGLVFTANQSKRNNWIFLLRDSISI